MDDSLNSDGYEPVGIGKLMRRGRLEGLQGVLGSTLTLRNSCKNPILRSTDMTCGVSRTSFCSVRALEPGWLQR